MIVRIWTIAVNTAREAIRNKLLYTFLFFALAMMLFGVVLATISYVERERMMQDFAFASIRLFSVAIAIFVGVGLIHKDIDRRTVYTILSKPLSRAEFLIGKFTGLVLIIWLQVAIMALFFAGISLLMGAPLGFTHLAALTLTAVELALVVALDDHDLALVHLPVLHHADPRVHQRTGAGGSEGQRVDRPFVRQATHEGEAVGATPAVPELLAWSEAHAHLEPSDGQILAPLVRACVELDQHPATFS